MEAYKDEEELILSEKIAITKEAKKLLKKIKANYRKEGRRVSMSKMVCNLIIETYGNGVGMPKRTGENNEIKK